METTSTKTEQLNKEMLDALYIFQDMVRENESLKKGFSKLAIDLIDNSSDGNTKSELIDKNVSLLMFFLKHIIFIDSDKIQPNFMELIKSKLDNN